MQRLSAVFCPLLDLIDWDLLGFSLLIFTGCEAEFSAVNDNPASIVFEDTEAMCCGFG
jgi:hypothetical protein